MCVLMQAVGGLYQWSICEGSWRESTGVDEGRWCYYIASGDVSNLKKNGFGGFWILATATTRMWRVFSSFFPSFFGWYKACEWWWPKKKRVDVFLVGGEGLVTSATMLQNDQIFRNQPNKKNDFHSIFLEHNHIEK